MRDTFCLEGKEMNESVKKIPSCVTMLQSLMPKLSDTKKVAGQYIIDHYLEIENLNITELAEVSGTSLSTIVRLTKDLGFKKYQDFKLNLVREIENPVGFFHEALKRDDTLETIKEKVFKSNSEAILSTLKSISEEEFEKAVELLANAKRIEFYGFGGSAAVALDASHKFLKIGVKCQALNDNDLQAMSASLLSEGDVVVAITHTGRNKALLYNLKLAREAGASVIVITNFGSSPVLKHADVTLFTTAQETAFKSDALSSRIAELTIIDALYVSIAFDRYEESNKNIGITRNATIGKKK